MSSVVQKNTISRKRLFGEWCCIIVLGTVAFTALSVSIYVHNHVPEPNVEFRPWYDFRGMILYSPIGWVVIGLFGPGWLVLAGLLGLLKTGKRGWHWLTGVGVAIFGWIWPTISWGWMGI